MTLSWVTINRQCTVSPSHLLLSALNPSPFPLTSFLGRISTFLLNSFLNSGVMILSAVTVTVGEVGGGLDALLPAVREGDDGPGGGAAVDCLRGAGKLPFLSMASTRRLYRRKRASARTRVESRSILVESSFTTTTVSI